MNLKVTYAQSDTEKIELIISKNNKCAKEIITFINSIKSCNLVFYKNNKEVYESIDNIIFFETELNYVTAHTDTDIYKVKYRLYELEKILPNYFVRVSKSTIVNIRKIYSINKNVTQPGVITFNNTHKKTYVSRMYFKKLKEELK